MSHDDAALDRKSRDLLDKVRRVRELECRKRASGRSTDEFHDLAEEVTDASRAVFEAAVEEEGAAATDSPRSEERRDDSPGDWTRTRREQG